MFSLPFSHSHFSSQKGNVLKGNVSFYRFQLPFGYRTNTIGNLKGKGHCTQTAKKVTTVRTECRLMQGYNEGKSETSEQLIPLPGAAHAAAIHHNKGKTKGLGHLYSRPRTAGPGGWDSY